jgi:hypothetical protein
MDSSETSAAVDSILTEKKVKSIFDPPDERSTSDSTVLPPSPLRFGPQTAESSDEEARNFILKYDPFLPKTTTSSIMPRIKLRKTPRLKNAPTCTHQFKRGPKKGEICAIFCKIGEEFCAKHKPAEKKPPPSSFDFETIAQKGKFWRLKVSKKYKLLQIKERKVILENSGTILKVRLPGYLKPIPKTGSYLIFQKTGEDGPAKAMWECV